MSFDPRRTDKPLQHIAIGDLAGALLPFRWGQPVLLRVVRSEAFYLPLFTNPVTLQAVMLQADAPYDKIKTITDPFEFLEHLPTEVEGTELKVVVNPHYTDTGAVRYTEIQRPEE